MKKYLILLGLVSFGIGSDAQAADKVWANTGTDYNTAANWSGGLPGAADSATFNSAVTNQPDLSEPIENVQLRFLTPPLTGGWTLSGGSALTLTSAGTGSGVGTGSAIVSLNTSGTNTISAPIVLGQDNGTTATFYQAALGTLELSGDISSPNAIAGLSLTTTNGKFILSGNNSYSGGTTITSGGITLSVSHNNALGAGPLTLASPTTSNAPTIQALGNDVALANDINGPAGTGAFNLTVSGTQNLSLNGLLNVNYGGGLTNNIGPGKFLTLGSVNIAAGGAASTRTLGIKGSGDTTITGTIANGSAGFMQNLSIQSTGTTTLSGTNSTYTGHTAIYYGAVLVVSSLADGGSNSSIGNSTEPIIISNGTLKYVGSGSSTNRTLSLTELGPATLDASGSGAVAFTSPSSIGRDVYTFTLTGNNTGNNTFAQKIILGTNLVKTGAGTWVLTNVNTFSGNVTVSAGTLVIGGNGSINSAGAIATAGSTAKLRYDSSVAMSRNVTVTGGGTFAYNSTSNYTGALALTDGKLGGTKWNGNLGGLTIGANQTITPGNSVGTAVTTTQTWADSGSYDWEINKGDGIAGDVSGGWDLLNLTGALTLSATSGSPFSINIISLKLDNTPGEATGFNSGSSYNWLIADAGSAISGFDMNKFSLSALGFQNAYSGAFGIELGNTGSLVGIGDTSQIYLTYTAIPEPSTWALLAFSLTTGMILRRRRNS